MYYCNDCNTEIENDDISYDAVIDADRCPECHSINVDYFKDAKNIEQANQPDVTPGYMGNINCAGCDPDTV